jgi:MoaA/NifB/PqqE/SkfB family radical SAM enzyme
MRAGSRGYRSVRLLTGDARGGLLPAIVGAADSVKRGGYLFTYVLRSLVGQKRPLLGGIKLTHACNLSCRHCPFCRREAGSLSFAQAVSSLAALHKLGVRILILEGGEPLLWRDGEYDVGDVIAEAKKLFFSVGVTTNGTWPIDVESDVVWVSVDGLEETHDLLRGKCFARVIENIQASSHPRIFAHVTINTLNWEEIPDLVAFLSPRVRGISVQFHYPFQEVEQELFLPFDRRWQVLDGLVEMKRRGYPIVNSYACLRALKDNRWRCRPWMVASVDPTGEIIQGCYLKGRGEIACERCGFSAHTEISLAYNGVIESILGGSRVFLSGTA